MFNKLKKWAIGVLQYIGIDIANKPIESIKHNTTITREDIERNFEEKLIKIAKEQELLIKAAEEERKERLNNILNSFEKREKLNKLSNLTKILYKIEERKEKEEKVNDIKNLANLFQKLKYKKILEKKEKKKRLARLDLLKNIDIIEERWKKSKMIISQKLITIKFNKLVRISSLDDAVQTINDTFKIHRQLDFIKLRKLKFDVYKIYAKVDGKYRVASNSAFKKDLKDEFERYIFKEKTNEIDETPTSIKDLKKPYIEEIKIYFFSNKMTKLSTNKTRI